MYKFKATSIPGDTNAGANGISRILAPMAKLTLILMNQTNVLNSKFFLFPDQELYQSSVYVCVCEINKTDKTNKFFLVTF